MLHPLRRHNLNGRFLNMAFSVVMERDANFEFENLHKPNLKKKLAILDILFLNSPALLRIHYKPSHSYSIFTAIVFVFLLYTLTSLACV